MAILILAALGGTIVRIPVDGNEIPELTVEILACCGKEYRDHWRYGDCVHCGKAMKSETGTGKMRLEIVRGALEVMAGGDFERLAVLRLSQIPNAKPDGVLVGPFALHGKDLDVEKLAKIEGVKSVEKAGDVVYINQGRTESRVTYGALSEFQIDDVSWVVNLCYGRIGFEKK